MRYKIILIILFLVIITICLYFDHCLKRKQFNISQTIEIYIKPKSSFSEIIRQLESQNLLSDPLICKIYFVATGKHKMIKAGYYRFDRSLNILEIADKLLKGEIVYYKITFPEGSNIFEIGKIIEDAKVIGYERFFQVINSVDVLMELKKIDNSLNSVEGYLFPETYYFAKGERLEELIKMMIKEFNRRNGELLRKRSVELGFNIHQIVTMASLIEKESANDEEKPLIASVFYNRLKRNMMLQCDPTVIYSHYLSGNVINILTKDDLRIQSPYNTYQNIGLPPGPICNPGEKSLNAAMYPAKTDYLYFVSMRNGSHYFSKSLQEHLKAKAIYLN